MDNLLTAEQLIAFENDIAECFNQKMIKAPVHLHNGNEKQLIEIFKRVEPEDWVVCSWRSHYQCLLKGYPQDKMKEHILAGRSIEMCSKEHKIISSAIVTGNIPIALGLAKDLQRKGEKGTVWCFVGDMTAMSGIFHEAWQYAGNFDLPIVFVIEDNGKSVCTDTLKTWGCAYHPWGDDEDEMTDENGILQWSNKLLYYKYDGSKYPHAGSGIRIQF